MSGIGDDDFVLALARMAAEVAADESARDRVRERTLRSVAEEEATLIGIVVDLAERQSPVVVRTLAGRAHRGTIMATGRDFLVVRDEPRAPVFVPLHGVASLRPSGTVDHDAAGARPSPLGTTFSAILVALAAERPRVQITAAGDEPVAGTLQSTGIDVVTLRLDGPGRIMAHVPIASVAELVLFDL